MSNTHHYSRSSSTSSLLGLTLTTSIIHSLMSLSHFVSQTNSSVPSSTNKSASPSILAPSQLRRSRPVQAAFSFVTPLPIEFPYSIKPTYFSSQPPTLTANDIESYLAQFEPQLQHFVQPALPSPRSSSAITPVGLTSPSRAALYQSLEPRLLNISSDLAQSCLPDLLVGSENSPERDELIKVLSGEIVLVRLPDQELFSSDLNLHSLDSFQSSHEELIRSKGYAPWSSAYAGHQFGQFAGQLGDGRAISICVSTPCTSSAIPATFNLPVVLGSTIKPKVEIQIKGAGRTPFARMADGLAVLRSSVREYVGAEACSSLPEFPTSRSLSLISLGKVEVERERLEKAAIVSRLAPSWIRIGNFELFRWREDWALLKKLVDYVYEEVFDWDPQQQSNQHDSRALKVLREVMTRNAKMVAAWQAWGFMHGVINTDNVSILGLTIDFGPYAFMDIFNPHHVCNHSDDLGRYDYSKQPDMIKFSLTKLGNSLAELIGYEIVKRETGDSDNFEKAMGSKENQQRFREHGIEAVDILLEQEFEAIYTEQYHNLMRKRLGLRVFETSDFEKLIKPLLDLMANRLDYSITLRALHQVPFEQGQNIDKSKLEEFVQIILNKSQAQDRGIVDKKVEWLEWLIKYIDRLKQEIEVDEINAWRDRMAKINPNFVLRQWVLEEVIKQLQNNGQDVDGLNRVMRLSRDPFVGTSGIHVSEKGLDKEDERLCGLGEERFLGFQCSCSS
uniref:Selenoprotein O n=1 Tax=Puccinia cf. psidii AE-2014 TaxID=1505670 RepID=A0A060II50_9BASI|nr:hypothetical protein [Puccinia cf. psidii AE-2014]